MNQSNKIYPVRNYIVKNNHIALLLLFVVIGMLIRVISLGVLPNGFHVDELDAGYIGRYILTHGKDVLGNTLPLTYNKFGDYRADGIFYLSGLSSLILGSNIFAVRLPVALFGAGTIIAIYLLAMELFHNKRIALFSAAALALLPWHIVLSRATSEGIVGLFFVCTGLGLLLRGTRIHSSRMIWFGITSLAISYLFYHSFRLLIPLTLIPLLWKPDHDLRAKKAVKITVISFILLSVIMSFTVAGKGRLNQVVFYKNPALVEYIQNLNNADGPTSVTSARIFHNKAIVYTETLIREYFKYFSTEFLVLKGGLPARYVIPEQGLMYLSFFVLLLGGLIALCTQPNRWLTYYILFLVILGPLPAAVTFEDTPNIHRTIFMILPIVLLIGTGFSAAYDIVSSRKKIYKPVISFLLFVITLEAAFFWHMYSVHAKSYQGIARNDGFVELIRYIQANKNKYKNIYVPVYDDMPLYYRFFASDYSTFTYTNLPNDTDIQKIGNVTFATSWCASNFVRRTERLDNSILIADREECEGFANLAIIYTIKRKDTTKAFTLNEYYGQPQH